ncbi:MAG: efflux RND transporter periplasmic adaptor subunit, partial [Sinobacteraceae bacterium]|nr:efflux RND transporter periplasmic adaptor subunit [Nevskiaceae bacterium]
MSISLRNFMQRGGRSRVVLIGVTALLLICAAFAFLTSSTDAAPPSRAQERIAVDAAAASRADVPVYLDGLGTIQAFNTVTVTSRVDGQLQQLGFVEGQPVHKGDLLAQIDPRPFQAALGQALAARAKDEAQLRSARADLERFVQLAPENLASKQTLDAQRATVAGLEAQLKGDQANIDNARTQLEYTRITSPIEGRTGIRRVDVGNNVHATDTSGIVVVTQLQPIAMIFTLPEESLPSITAALGQGEVAVSARARDGSVELDRGTLALVDNQIDQTTGTIRLKAVFPNARNTLWPGQFIDAQVLVRTEHNALTIPNSALQRGPNGLFAYVIRPDATVEARPLQVGAESGSQVVVQNGLSAGEQVVTSNQYRLQPGAQVRVTSAVRAADQPGSAQPATG